MSTSCSFAVRSDGHLGHQARSGPQRRAGAIQVFHAPWRSGHYGSFVVSRRGPQIPFKGGIIFFKGAPGVNFRIVPFSVSHQTIGVAAWHQAFAKIEFEAKIAPRPAEIAEAGELLRGGSAAT